MKTTITNIAEIVVSFTISLKVMFFLMGLYRPEEFHYFLAYTIVVCFVCFLLFGGMFGLIHVAVDDMMKKKRD